MIYALGADPGFASFGWAIFALAGRDAQLVRMGVIRTEKSSKKTNVLATEDNLVRARFVSRELLGLLDLYQVRVIASESMSFPRNSSAAAKVAMSWGVLATLTEIRDLPLVQASPQKVKKLCVGVRAVSKIDIQNHVTALYPQPSAAFVASHPKTMHEHGFDAAAVVLACQDSEVFRLVRG